MNHQTLFMSHLEIQITNMFGDPVIYVQNQTTIDVSALIEGQYALQITSGNASITKIFVKE